MPRDDLSIDFVVKRMPPVEALDPSLILDEWIMRTQNLPEEIRFLQDEIAYKDRQYDKLVREIDERDGRIQKWIKANGSHTKNPKEEEYRATIKKNLDLAEKLSEEKLALTQKLQQTMDKHVRHLDMQIKMLYDRAEPGFTDPDELPSLIRPSAANVTNTPVIRPSNSSTNPVTAAIANHPTTTIRLTNSQLRNAQSQHGSASAPATPAASMIMNRQARESSAGPSMSGQKRGPRISNLPAASSGLARHSSLGPGTPKAHQTATGAQRAGSAGPRAIGKGAGASSSRKSGTPSSTAGRSKKSSLPGGAGGGGNGSGGGAGSNKSGLSRVKKAAKNSPSSAAESELSDAESGSDDDSDTRTTGGRGTPALSRSGSNQADRGGSQHNKEGSHERESLVGAGNAGGNGPKTKHEDEDEDAMDLEDDDAGDDKKYCLCQNVSFGDMVACDNQDCPYEWFHWGCVGLKSEPNGTWYCPPCAENMRKLKSSGRAAS